MALNLYATKPSTAVRTKFGVGFNRFVANRAMPFLYRFLGFWSNLCFLFCRNELILGIGSVKLGKSAFSYTVITISVMRRSTFGAKHNVIIFKKVGVTNNTLSTLNI
jgi:hypothetical protein